MQVRALPQVQPRHGIKGRRGVIYGEPPCGMKAHAQRPQPSQPPSPSPTCPPASRSLHLTAAEQPLEEQRPLSEQVDPVALEWSDLSCVLTTKEGGQKQLLSGVTGVARPGRLLALMGPSGSGKTTLLNALAGQLPQSKSMTLSGAWAAFMRRLPSEGSCSTHWDH